MELFIQVKDGKPFEHPIFADNFRQAFPHVDTNNLPPEFLRFVRVTPPKIGPYEVYEGVSYEITGGVCMDVHHVRQMTPEEVLEKQKIVKDGWATGDWKSWIFNEEKCCFEAPIPYPDDGKFYIWRETTLSWVEVIA